MKFVVFESSLSYNFILYDVNQVHRMKRRHFSKSFEICILRAAYNQHESEVYWQDLCKVEHQALLQSCAAPSISVCFETIEELLLRRYIVYVECVVGGSSHTDYLLN